MKSPSTPARLLRLVRPGPFPVAALLALLLSVVAPLNAHAAGDPAEAERHYELGLKHYNVGRFDEAASEFEKAYEISPDPTLLFNIAQAHRQNGRLDQSISFLKRYLQASPKARDRREVERRIREMERALEGRDRSRSPAQPEPQYQAPPAYQPPPPPEPPPYGRQDAPPPPPPSYGAPPPPYRSAEPGFASEPVFTPPPAPTAPTPPPAPPPPEPLPEKPPLVSFRLRGEGGVLFPFLTGPRSLGQPVLLAVQGSLAYVAALNADGTTTLDLGLMAGFSPFSYTTLRTELTSYADLVSLLGGTTLHVPMGNNAAFETAFGIGVTWWRGLGTDNPFTRSGQAASGAVPMPTARLSLSFLWNIAPVAYLGIAPSFEGSWTNHAVLADVMPYFFRMGINAVVAVGF